MSIATLILGEPGSGKSTSMRNLNPAETLLIQTIKKPLPFRGWTLLKKNSETGEVTGNVVVSDVAAQIINYMTKTARKIIVLDDWNLLMTNEFMRRSAETGFQKFSDIGRSAWDVMMAASSLPDDVRVYMLGHTSMDETGHIRAKTIGKLVDEKCPVESMFTTVLRAMQVNGQYVFQTQSTGMDTCKSPLGLFETEQIPNDLKEVDRAIAAYYLETQPA